MASIETRRRTSGEEYFMVRWRANGKQESEPCATYAEARKFMLKVEHDLVTGKHISRKAGSVRLRDYGEQWLQDRPYSATTQLSNEAQFRRHIEPHLGDKTLAKLTVDDVQKWITLLSKSLAPGTVQNHRTLLGAMLSTAQANKLIHENVARNGTLVMPTPDKKQFEVWDDDMVLDMRETLPPRDRIAVILCAGLGLRQGEAIGLSAEDVDFRRQTVRVRQQVRILGWKQSYAPPKYNRERKVPLNPDVAAEIKAYMEQFPPLPVTLPYLDLEGAPKRLNLIWTTRQFNAVHRNGFNRTTWKPALIECGIEPTRANMMHALRHYWASTQADSGLQPAALAQYLGHADAGFTMRVYTHTTKAAEGLARDTMSRVFGRKSEGGDDNVIKMRREA